jgi:RNA polymerase sigma-70 factor, ECF subfamily
MLGMADSGGGVEKTGPGADLLAVAQRRDRDAFERLFAFYAPRVKAYLGRLGVGDEVADELTEETMLAVWQRAPRFVAARVPASAWIFAIARDKRAGAARPGRWPAVDADEEAPGVDGTITEPPIRYAVDSLPEPEAELLRIFYYEESADVVLGDRLGLSPADGRSRLRHALRDLVVTGGDG